MKTTSGSSPVSKEQESEDTVSTNTVKLLKTANKSDMQWSDSDLLECTDVPVKVASECMILVILIMIIMALI